jgi:hypothetical protein
MGTDQCPRSDQSNEWHRRLGTRREALGDQPLGAPQMPLKARRRMETGFLYLKARPVTNLQAKSPLIEYAQIYIFASVAKSSAEIEAAAARLMDQSTKIRPR